MSKLDELLAKQAAIAEEIAVEKAAMRSAVLEDVKRKIAEFQITATELKTVLTKRKRKMPAVSAPSPRPPDGTKRPRGRPRKLTPA